MDKRQFAISAAGVLLTTAMLPGLVLAQDKYPSKPVTLLVPFPPGGVADIVARSLAPALEKKWGQSVVVVNRPGAGGALGTGQLANARPDGYTL